MKCQLRVPCARRPPRPYSPHRRAESAEELSAFSDDDVEPYTEAELRAWVAGPNKVLVAKGEKKFVPLASPLGLLDQATMALKQAQEAEGRRGVPAGTSITSGGGGAAIEGGIISTSVRKPGGATGTASSEPLPPSSGSVTSEATSVAYSTLEQRAQHIEFDHHAYGDSPVCVKEVDGVLIARDPDEFLQAVEESGKGSSSQFFLSIAASPGAEDDEALPGEAMRASIVDFSKLDVAKLQSFMSRVEEEGGRGSDDESEDESEQDEEDGGPPRGPQEQGAGARGDGRAAPAPADAPVGGKTAAPSPPQQRPFIPFPDKAEFAKPNAPTGRSKNWQTVRQNLKQLQARRAEQAAIGGSTSSSGDEGGSASARLAQFRAAQKAGVPAPPGAGRVPTEEEVVVSARSSGSSSRHQSVQDKLSKLRERKASLLAADGVEGIPADTSAKASLAKIRALRESGALQSSARGGSSSPPAPGGGPAADTKPPPTKPPADPKEKLAELRALATKTQQQVVLCCSTAHSTRYVVVLVCGLSGLVDADGWRSRTRLSKLFPQSSAASSSSGAEDVKTKLARLRKAREQHDIKGGAQGSSS